MRSQIDNETTHASSAKTLNRLQAQNQRLRTALAALAGAAVGAVVLGLAPAAEPRSNDPVSITSDGTYLYTLLRNGNIFRVDIETREDAKRIGNRRVLFGLLLGALRVRLTTHLDQFVLPPAIDCATQRGWAARI